MAIPLVLRLLARRARATDLDSLAAVVGSESPEIGWNDIERL
jgi:hypothetical protein